MKKGMNYMDEYVHGSKSSALEMLQKEAKFANLDNIHEPSDAFFASPSWNTYVDSIVKDALNLGNDDYDDLCA